MLRARRAQFFDTLGVRPTRGRSFAPDADRPGQPPVALISDRLGHRKFGGKENTVGRVVNVNGRATTIIGILPNIPILDPDADIWSIFPLKMMRFVVQVGVIQNRERHCG